MIIHYAYVDLLKNPEPAASNQALFRPVSLSNRGLLALGVREKSIEELRAASRTRKGLHCTPILTAGYVGAPHGTVELPRSEFTLSPLMKNEL
jgi:hypothetical protein